MNEREQVIEKLARWLETRPPSPALTLFAQAVEAGITETELAARRLKHRLVA